MAELLPPGYVCKGEPDVPERKRRAAVLAAAHREDLFQDFFLNSLGDVREVSEFH